MISINKPHPKLITAAIRIVAVSAVAIAAACLLSYPSYAAPAKDIETAFWSRDWKAMDTLSGNEAASADKIPSVISHLTAKEKSLYLNALWMQGRYPEGLSVLESVSGDLPHELRPYSSMFMILGMERTGRKDEAHDIGAAMWSEAPQSVRYYLAYAMGRLSASLSKPEEALSWYRTMLELAPDRKRRVQALVPMIDLPGVTTGEAALLLIDFPSNKKALEICRKAPGGTDAKVEYALGYNAYINKRYSDAIKHLELASADKGCKEAALYYRGYAAYRDKKDGTAYESWAAITHDGFDYPQRSVARLTALAKRHKKPEIIELFKKIAAERTDYPELAADALAGLIRLGDERTAQDAEKKLFADYPFTSQAATLRWEKGWQAWKSGDTKAALAQWSDGYEAYSAGLQDSSKIKNRELASRMLYWQMKALKKLDSPVAAERVKRELMEGYPAEYHTFLASPDGGIKQENIPENYHSTSILEEWGFVTYARIEAAANSLADPNAQSLYRSIRLSHWEGDFASGVRAFSTLQKHIPASELASSELLKNAYPRAFEPDVLAASKKTGLDTSIIWGVMRQESLYEPDVTSTAGAYGLMQLMPATGRSEAKKLKMEENSYRQPTVNILLGANHMVGLLARFKDTPRSLAAYNAGGTPVTRWSKDGIGDMEAWIEDIPYRETRGYVKAVMRNINAYMQIYRGGGGHE